METGLIAAVLLGALTGFRHAFEPDHVIAVSTLLHREPSLKRAARTGIAWGMGHTATLMVGVIAVSILRIPISETYLHFLELPVGILLVAIGFWALRGAWRGMARLRCHTHGGVPHLHVGNAPHPHSFDNRRAGWRGFAVGSVHGLAGSGALLLLTAAILPSVGASILYALVFGAGSMIGMAGVSCGLALPFLMSRSRPYAFNMITGLSGCAGILLGMWILSSPF